MKRTSYNNIIKNLVINTKRHDKLVSATFYQYRLNQLKLTRKDVINLFNKCQRNYFGLMSIIRAEQLGLISKQQIYSIIINNKSLSYGDLQEMNFQIKTELYRILDIDELKILCEGDTKIFTESLNLRFGGKSKDEVYSYVNAQLYNERIYRDALFFRLCGVCDNDVAHYIQTRLTE